MNQRQKILKALESNLFVKTDTLRVLACQYNARINELRKQGYRIVAIRYKGKAGFML